jgi:hypothetical protein
MELAAWICLGAMRAVHTCVVNALPTGLSIDYELARD